MSITPFRPRSSVGAHRAPIILKGKALERRFIRAARQNRSVELNELSRIEGALSEKTFVLASSRLHKSDSFVSRARTIQLVANLWREHKGQSLGVTAAVHIGKKLLNDHINEIVANRRDAKAASDERSEALTQIFSLVEPELRVTAHAMLLSQANDRALYERTIVTMRPGDERLSSSELQEVSRQRTRRIEQGSFEFLGSAAIRASSFDGIDANYEAIAPSVA